MKILFWDTETTPLITYSWSLWPNSIPIQQIIEPQKTMCWGARWHAEKRVTVMSEYRDGRSAMLTGIWDRLDEADAVVSWNGMGYDSKHIRREFLEAGMTPPSPWKEIDLMKVARSQFKFPSNKLDYVAQDLGVGKKTPHAGFEMWKSCMGANGAEVQERAWRQMYRYQRQDVNLLVELYDYFLPWITNHPNRALIDSVADGCKTCASTDIQKRGFHYSGAGKFQRYLCKTCGAWFHDSKRIETTLAR